MATNYIAKALRYLIQKRINDHKSIKGWLTENEAIGLYELAAGLPKKSTVVEIGSWQGKSTFCLAKGLKSGLVYAIDPFNADGGADFESTEEYKKNNVQKDLLEIFKLNIEKYKIKEKIFIKKGYSTEFNNDFDKINCLFIDGDHSIEGCKTDYDLYANKIVKGGIIAFHDYYSDRPELGPTYVINEIVKKSGKFTFYKQYDSLWTAKRT